MAHLHAVIGDQTTKKLEDILQVTEENRTTLIARLIREEWERQRESYSANAIYVGGSPEPVRVDVSTSPEDAVRRRRAEAFVAIHDESSKPGLAQLREGGH